MGARGVSIDRAAPRAPMGASRNPSPSERRLTPDRSNLTRGQLLELGARYSPGTAANPQSTGPEAPPEPAQRQTGGGASRGAPLVFVKGVVIPPPNFLNFKGLR